MELHTQPEHMSETGYLFYTDRYNPYSKTITYVIGEHLYQKTFGCETLNSRGLPHDHFHLAFKTGFETNIYRNTYSSYYITVMPNNATINLTLRFAVPSSSENIYRNEIRNQRPQSEVEFEPGMEIYPIELPRIDFNVEPFLQKITVLQQNYSRLYQLALLNYFQMTPCDFLTQQMFAGQSWKNVPIVNFIRVIDQIESRILDVVDLFRVNGRQHILDEFMFAY